MCDLLIEDKIEDTEFNMYNSPCGISMEISIGKYAGTEFFMLHKKDAIKIIEHLHREFKIERVTGEL